MGLAVIFKTSVDVVPRAPNASLVGANSVNLPAPFRVSIRPARVTRSFSVVWFEEPTTTSTMVSGSAVTEPARASSTAQSRPRESMLMVTVAGARDLSSSFPYVALFSFKLTPPARVDTPFSSRGGLTHKLKNAKKHVVVPLC
jgi:hypothetical protein